MAATVHLTWLFDDGAGTPAEAAELADAGARLAQRFEQDGVEATFLITGASARAWAEHGEWRAALKRHDVGFRFAPDAAAIAGLDALDAKTGLTAFTSAALADYEAVTFFAGRVPSTFAIQPWTPTIYAALAEWGLRVCVTDATLFRQRPPFFVSGRLHLTLASAIRLDGKTAADTWLATLRAKVDETAAAGGGVLPVATPLTLGGAQHVDFWETVLPGIAAMPGVVNRSGRQLADALADISYEHAIPMEQLQAMARFAAAGVLEPYRYTAGYLSPAEQLYLLATAWETSRQKGKLVRNSTSRTPLPPLAEENSSLDLTTIPSSALPEVLAAVIASYQKDGRLPGSAPVGELRIALQDLLPTLAAGFTHAPAAVDLPVQRAHWPTASGVDDTRSAGAFARQLLWTFKPVLELAAR